MRRRRRQEVGEHGARAQRNLRTARRRRSGERRCRICGDGARNIAGARVAVRCGGAGQCATAAKPRGIDSHGAGTVPLSAGAAIACRTASPAGQGACRQRVACGAARLMHTGLPPPAPAAACGVAACAAQLLHPGCGSQWAAPGAGARHRHAAFAWRAAGPGGHSTIRAHRPPRAAACLWNASCVASKKWVGRALARAGSHFHLPKREDASPSMAAATATRGMAENRSKAVGFRLAWWCAGAAGPVCGFVRERACGSVTGPWPAATQHGPAAPAP